MNTNQLQLAENLERIQAGLNLDDNTWLELLGVSKLEYLRVKSGRILLPNSKLDELAKYSGIHEKSLLTDEVDYRRVKPMFPELSEIPQRYTKGAHGRWRNSILALEFIESKYGWRARHACLKFFGLNETLISNPFGRVSMQFMQDLCSYLYERQFSLQDIFEMGAYANILNRNTILGQNYANKEDPESVYKSFMENIEVYERNCTYNFEYVNKAACAIRVKSIKDVTEEIGVYKLGSHLVCQWKAGFISSLTSYLNLPHANVTETQCVHRGDKHCLFEADYSQAYVANENRPKVFLH
ncbi:MAG: 4-vinyl reductase [Bacteriovoracaceae bacterium]|nr:4-vinyl reductase [Bacteriovoracaceae bacterium]